MKANKYKETEGELGRFEHRNCCNVAWHDMRTLHRVHAYRGGHVNPFVCSTFFISVTAERVSDRFFVVCLTGIWLAT